MVTPLPALDAAARLRRELKFLIRAADAVRARDLLEARANPLQFGQEAVSRVHSIYFDDATLGACRESLAGVGRRLKLRLRWYDSDDLPETAHLETKIRQGLRVSKIRSTIHLPATKGKPLYEVLLRHLHDQAADEQRAQLSLRGLPTVLVSYQRRHYRDPASGARLTLDEQIRGYDQTGRFTVSRDFPADVSGAAVIEIKLPDGDPSVVARLLAPLDGRSTRFSKYVQCCARMGWCSLHDMYA
jgi:hypothetical protein